jgi:hypothetical protein
MRLDIALADTEKALAATNTDEWEAKRDLVRAECHPKQRDFVCDPHRRIAALCGRGAGKTTAGRARLVLRLLGTPRARCLYIATTRDQAERLMWGPLKELFEKLGFRAGVDVTYNETKLRVTLKRNGAMLWLFGADDKREIDKLRGQAFHEVGIDEAASYPVELLRQLITRVIGPRLGDYGGCIWLIGTPGPLLQGLFYEATRPGSEWHRAYADRNDPEFADWSAWSSHAWTLQDGAKTVAAMARLWAEALIEKKAQQFDDSSPVWRREYLGEWSADSSESCFQYRPHDSTGAPFNQWDPERVGPMRVAKLPDEFSEWSYVVAMDLGHSDPFALNVFAFAPSDVKRRIWHVYGFEKTKMYAQTIAYHLIGEELDHVKPDGLFGEIGWPDGLVADLAGLGDSLIEELSNVYGIRVLAAEKKHKYSAMDVVNGDLADGRLKILKGSSLERQLMSLQWKADEYGQLKENKGQPNHSSDCLVYARRVIGNMISAGTVAVEVKKRARQPLRDDASIPRDDYQAPGEYDSLLGNNDYGDLDGGGFDL